jgi:hypothetical protein
MDVDDSCLLVRRHELDVGTEAVMFESRNHLFSRVVVSAAILIYAGVAFAQDEDADQVEDTTDEVIEEVVVYAYKPGDEIDMDARYAELFRTRAAAELDRLEVLDEEYKWRVAMTEADSSSSRIKWGYNPEDDMSRRRDTTLTDLPTDVVKPATLFRVEF